MLKLDENLHWCFDAKTGHTHTEAHTHTHRHNYNELEGSGKELRIPSV